MKKNKNYKKIEDNLRDIQFSELDASERESVWQNIALEIKKPAAFPWLQTKNKKMVPIMITAMLFVGVSGTAVLADSSRPGEALFRVDRAVENVRLALAGNEKKAELRVKFSEERLKEVKELAEKHRNASSTDVALGVNTAITFLNKVSADLSATSTSATTTAEAKVKIADIITRLEAVVNSDASIKAQIRSDEDFKLRIKGEHGDGVKINTNGNKSRIEVREDGEKIRIEIKNDNDVRIKTKVDTRVDTKVDTEVKGLLDLSL